MRERDANESIRPRHGEFVRQANFGGSEVRHGESVRWRIGGRIHDRRHNVLAESGKGWYARAMSLPFLRTSRCVVWFSVLLASGGIALADIEVTLKNTFIEKFKDRATIDASFSVDKAHKRPNTPAKDGDLHVAGRATQVGLPMVAEIMNAKSQVPSMDAIHAAETNGQKVELAGVWRLWCEHGGDVEQVQGAALQKFKTTNPPHVFQIHPVTSVNGTSIVNSLEPTEGYTPKTAEAAFTKYEALRFHMDVSKSSVTSFTTTMAGFNYAEFVMKPNEEPRTLADGTGVLATVYTLEGELLVHERRMVFVKDSSAEAALKALPAGQGLKVIGIPRISLKLHAWRRERAKTNKKVLSWGLPYEMVIVGSSGTVPIEEEE